MNKNDNWENRVCLKILKEDNSPGCDFDAILLIESCACTCNMCEKIIDIDKLILKELDPGISRPDIAQYLCFCSENCKNIYIKEYSKKAIFPEYIVTKKKR